MKMNGMKIPFATQKTGYNQDQVDRYIGKLADEYASLQQKYSDLYAKYDVQSKQSDVGLAAVSKAIVDAEVRAIQIVAEANNEASQIKGNAHVELVQIQHEKDRVVNEIFEMIRNLKGVVPFSIDEV